jgi:LacI family transcriptional regulator
MEKKKTTIVDISKAADVSPTTVSLALNNNPRISSETRKKILRIAKSLNYQPNLVARNLVGKKSHTLGLIITTILNPFYPELAKGIEDKAMELGYNIILCSTNYDLKLERYSIDILRSKGVDGIIFSSVEVNDFNIRPLIEDHFPFVLVNRRIHNRLLDKKLDYVVQDNVSGGYLAVEHLLKLGHRRIGVITGGLNVSTAVERTDGAKKALKDWGIKFEPDLLIECTFSKELAYEATRRFISMRKPPTAIFAENDFMAVGAREALLEAGLRIPKDIALVGFDDISIAALKGVELTTINSRKYEMGSMGLQILIEKIEDREASMVNQIILQPELVIRKSCGYSLHGYKP